jgi:hypothetical protein
VSAPGCSRAHRVWFPRLKLKYGVPLSNIDLYVNLRPYTMAWGNSWYYSRYIRLLLGDHAGRGRSDDLGLTREQRRRVVILRPEASFAMWKYFRPNTWQGGH